jgi:hypothetical protein
MQLKIPQRDGLRFTQDPPNSPKAVEPIHGPILPDFQLQDRTRLTADEERIRTRIPIPPWPSIERMVLLGSSGSAYASATQPDSNTGSLRRLCRHAADSRREDNEGRHFLRRQRLQAE